MSNHLNAAKTRIAAAAEKSGRTPQDVQLVAVSKRQPVEAIREIFDAGHTCFGESRVQEALEKLPLLPSTIDWHFIGALQKNKIRKILPLVSTIHSIDTLETARAVDRIAAEIGSHPEVYLQVNAAGEASKHGFAPEALESSLEEIAALPRLQLLGLMAIPPRVPSPELARPHFAALRTLRDRLEKSVGVPLPGLSMGMSADFAVAIEEGATSVRLGTTIFGPRKPI